MGLAWRWCGARSESWGRQAALARGRVLPRRPQAAPPGLKGQTGEAAPCPYAGAPHLIGDPTARGGPKWGIAQSPQVASKGLPAPAPRFIANCKVGTLGSAAGKELG